MILSFIKGSIGNGINQLNTPRAVTIDPTTGTVYIVDKDNHRILSYSPSTSAVNIVAGGNGAGTSSTRLKLPAGVAYDSSTNSIIIANYDANNVVRWQIGATSWSIVAGDTNGGSGSSSTRLKGPYDVTIDSTGNIYVADTLNHRIQFFPVGSTIGTTIAGTTSTAGANAISLENPVSVALDSQFNLYVSDKDNHRIQRFTRLLN